MSQDRIVTPIDILNEQVTLEKEANDALPYKFDQCTFEKGRLNQPVYVCLDCYKDQPDLVGGVCYSCSISCHSSHNVLELFNKRNFICECGTSAKYTKHCFLNNNKPELLENEYNHNYKGLYCKCNTYYDPEDEDIVMLQCHFCCDWFHEECVGEMIEEYEDFVCYDCVDKHTFLLNYYNNPLVRIELAKPNKALEKEAKNTVEVDQVSETLSDKDKTKSELSEDHKKPLEQECETVPENQIKINTAVKLETPNLPFIEKGEANKLQPFIAEIENLLKEDIGNNCIKARSHKTQNKYNVFGLDGWNEVLCTCEKCKNLYKSSNLEFLLSEEVYVPESDPTASNSIVELGMRALSNIPRTDALNVTEAYVNVKRKIIEFVEPFRNSDKIITKEDVMDFFKKNKTD